MAMLKEFIGNMAHTIDQKGRVTIPAMYRDTLGEIFYIGMNTTFTAVALYTKEKWEEMSRWMNGFPESDARAMAYVRLIRGSIFPGETDAQGRVLIPSDLRALTNMDKAIRFVGMGQYLEIWNEERYASERAQSQASIADLLSYLNDKYSQS